MNTPSPTPTHTNVKEASMTPESLIYVAVDGTETTLPTADAMALYASNGFAGRLVAPATPAPVAPVVAPVAPVEATPAPAPVAPQTANDAGAVAARERNAAQVERLNQMGFALAEPFFAVGTPLIQSGKDKFKAIARDHASKPPIEEAAMEAANRIEAERRTDFTVDLRDLRIDNRGQITRGKGSIPLETQAWNALVAAAAPVLPSARALLEVVDPDLRADIWNRQIAKLQSEKLMKVGVRRGNEGDWRAFRALNGTYPTEAQANVVLRGVAEAIKGENMRGSVTYDPVSTRVRFEGAWMMPQELDPRVGDVMRVGFAGSTADAANGAFKVSMGVTRILCVNLTISDAYIAAFRRDHRGDLSSVVGDIAATVRAIPEAFSAFAADWRIARDTGVDAIRLKGQTYKDVPAALADLVERGVITAQVAKDALLESLLRAHSAEPGDSIADLLNAVTRAAHEAEWSEFNRSMLEHRAGELMPILLGARSAIAPA